MQGHWTIKGADATKGALAVYWDGARPRFPSTERWPNSTDAPMKKQGAIILGIGGDNSHGAVGTFYVRLQLIYDNALMNTLIYTTCCN